MRDAVPSKLFLCVKDFSSGKTFDMELPSNMPIKMLSQGIAKFLNASGMSTLSVAVDHEIWHNDRKLRDSETLASLGIWDGSEIIIRERKEVGRCT